MAQYVQMSPVHSVHLTAVHSTKKNNTATCIILSDISTLIQYITGQVAYASLGPRFVRMQNS